MSGSSVYMPPPEAILNLTTPNVCQPSVPLLPTNMVQSSTLVQCTMPPPLQPTSSQGGRLHTFDVTSVQPLDMFPSPQPETTDTSAATNFEPAISDFVQTEQGSDGSVKVTIGCPVPKVDGGTANPSYNRTQITSELALFTAINAGPLPLRCNRCVLVKPSSRETWCTVNYRAMAVGGFHAAICPFCKEPAMSANEPVSLAELARLRATNAALVRNKVELVGDLETGKLQIAELETDLLPWHAKHGRWQKRQVSHPSGDTKSAFREFHEELKEFQDLKPSSQNKLISIHMHPRMEALYYLSGGTREAFTTMLGVWASKHTANVHWHGSCGVNYDDRYISSYIDFLRAAPEVWASERERIMATAECSITTREMIDCLDEAGDGQRGADVWRRALGNLPAKGKVLAQRKVNRAKRDDLIGKWNLKEVQSTDKNGKLVTKQFFWLDAIRALVDAIIPVYLMECLQPKLAPKRLIDEAEVRLLDLEAELVGGVSDAREVEIGRKKVKIEASISQGTRNGSYSRSSFDDIQEAAQGTLIHNQVRQGRPVIGICSSWGHDHANMYGEGATKSDQTPFMVNITNGSLAVQSKDNIFVHACGDGHDSLDDQEAIIKVFNEEILGRLGEEHVISREVLMLANNKVPYFVEEVEVGLTEERGGDVAVCLDLAAMMDTVDKEEAPCSISSEHRCDDCYIAKKLRVDPQGVCTGHQSMAYAMHIVEVKSGFTQAQIMEDYFISRSDLQWMNKPRNHSEVKNYTVAKLYDTHHTNKKSTIDLSKYQEDERITFPRREKHFIRVRLMFKQDRKIDSRLSNLKPRMKRNDPMHLCLRLKEQMVSNLERYSKKSIKQINAVFRSQNLSYKSKDKADGKEDSGSKSFARPKIGQMWKVKEFYKPSPTVPGKKVWEVLIAELDNNRASTLKVWATHEKLMKILLWQYPEKEAYAKIIGPVTFQAFVSYIMRYPAEDVQIYHHKYFGHMIHQALRCPTGLQQLQGKENKHSETKRLIKTRTKKGGCGVTVLSEETELWGDMIWRFTRATVKSEMREVLVEDAEKCAAGSADHKENLDLLRKFDAIEHIKWRDFIKLQQELLDETNCKRSSVPIDVDNNPYSRKAKKKRKESDANLRKKQGWKNLLNEAEM